MLPAWVSALATAGLWLVAGLAPVSLGVAMALTLGGAPRSAGLLCVALPFVPFTVLILRAQARRMGRLLGARQALTDRGRRLLALDHRLLAFGPSPVAEVGESWVRFGDGVVFACLNEPEGLLARVEELAPGAAQGKGERVVWEGRPRGWKGLLASVGGAQPDLLDLALPLVLVPGLGWISSWIVIYLIALLGIPLLLWAKFLGSPDAAEALAGALWSSTPLVSLGFMVSALGLYLDRCRRRVAGIRYAITDQGRGLVSAGPLTHAFRLPERERITARSGPLVGVVRFDLSDQTAPPGGAPHGWPVGAHPLVLFYGVRDPHGELRRIAEAAPR